MWFAIAMKGKLILVMAILTILVSFSYCNHMSPMTCNGSLSVSCPALVYYVPKPPKSIDETMGLFGVSSNLVNRTGYGYVIEGTCHCLTDHDEFSWHVDYMVQRGDTWDGISSKFGGLVAKKPDKTLIATTNVTLDIICGCSESSELITYSVNRGDTLYSLCSQFSCNVDKVAEVNNFDNPALIYAGDAIFIPVPAGGKGSILPVDSDRKPKKHSRLRIYIIAGIVLGAVLILLLVIVVVWRHYRREGSWQSKTSMRGIRPFPRDLNAFPSRSEISLAISHFSDKATDFSFSELREATSNFSSSRMIGQGSYGSVYLGKLRGIEVAIKQMKNTKSKEFFSELNILCTVHHTNLIELIGFAAGGESLFLIFEFAQNGALSSHLHNPALRGCKPLPWSTRVQIALDAAKGLEYIHVHIKPFYVHRDVKTSNILLDSNFRAKIADFGLVKLLEHSPDMGTTASRIVGTLGYLAPEYVRDGCVTTKSDVYGFGVVLMELLTGQPPLSRDATPINTEYIQHRYKHYIATGYATMIFLTHRSLVDYVLSFLEDEDPLVMLTQCIDLNLACYHNDSLLQMALLARDCVDEDWNRRPDMSKVMQRLSEIHTSSQEWVTSGGEIIQTPKVTTFSWYRNPSLRS